MPMISGTHKCTKCGHEMFWEHHLPDPVNNIRAFTYTKDSHSVKKVNSDQSGKFEFRIECTKCNQIDFFTYDNSKK